MSCGATDRLQSGRPGLFGDRGVFVPLRRPAAPAHVVPWGRCETGAERSGAIRYFSLNPPVAHFFNTAARPVSADTTTPQTSIVT